jgi:hypothetical protein
MIRILLLFVFAVGFPFVAFILWRAYMPPKFGGSRSIAREEWEPLPWVWLGVASAICMLAAFTVMILYTEWFGAV